MFAVLLKQTASRNLAAVPTLQELNGFLRNTPKRIPAL